MKVLGHKKLQRQFNAMPVKSKDTIAKAIKRNTEKAARVARALAPYTTGETKGDIFTEYSTGGMKGSVEAARPTKEEQQRARAIEFGRKKGERGTTPEQPYIRPASSFIRQTFGRSIKSALRKALKQATNG